VLTLVAVHLISGYKTKRKINFHLMNFRSPNDFQGRYPFPKREACLVPPTGYRSEARIGMKSNSKLNAICTYEIQGLPTDCLQYVQHGSFDRRSICDAYICSISAIQIMKNLATIFVLQAAGTLFCLNICF
jgi:hypothetical protein